MASARSGDGFRDGDVVVCAVGTAITTYRIVGNPTEYFGKVVVYGPVVATGWLSEWKNDPPGRWALHIDNITFTIRRDMTVNKRASLAALCQFTNAWK